MLQADHHDTAGASGRASMPLACVQDGSLHTLLVAAPLMSAYGASNIAVLTSVREVAVVDAAAMATASATRPGTTSKALLRLQHTVSHLAVSEDHIAASHGSKVGALPTVLQLEDYCVTLAYV